MQNAPIGCEALLNKCQLVPERLVLSLTQAKDKLLSCDLFSFLEAASLSRAISDSIASRTRETALEAVSHEGLQGAAEA
jgi:hypothetical protein